MAVKEGEEVSHSFNLKQNNTVLNQSKNYFVSNSYFFQIVFPQELSEQVKGSETAEVKIK